MTTTTATPTFSFPFIPGFNFTPEMIPAFEEWAQAGCQEDFPAYFDRWAKGDLSSKSVDELAEKIANWTGCLEDLILMIMIAVSKDMDKAIKGKAEEVLKLRKENEGKKSADKNTEALDQATQELQQMQKQRDMFFQMFQKILDALTASVEKLLSSWRSS